MVAPLTIYFVLYNNTDYSRILIGSRLWSIRGQTRDWRHHYKVFSLRDLKWGRKVLRIYIMFHLTGQKIRNKKVFEQLREEKRRKKKRIRQRIWIFWNPLSRVEKHKSAASPITCGRVSPDSFESDDVANSCPVSYRTVNQYGGTTATLWRMFWTHFIAEEPWTLEWGSWRGKMGAGICLF